MKLKIKTRIEKKDPNLYYYVLVNCFNDLKISDKDSSDKLAYLVSDEKIEAKKWSDLIKNHNIEMR